MKTKNRRHIPQHQPSNNLLCLQHRATNFLTSSRRLIVGLAISFLQLIAKSLTVIRRKKYTYASSSVLKASMLPKKSAASAKAQMKPKKPPIKATQSKTSETKAAASASGSRNAKRKNEEPDSHHVAKSHKVKHDAPNGRAQPAKSKDLDQAPKVVRTVTPKAVKPKVVINQVPKERLNVYAFGSNEQGELGFGDGRSPDGGVRPRLNPKLAGTVQIATGGMHCAALTHDNKILTWGVNDLGALGRDTEWDGGWVDIKDANADQDSDVGDANPKEATPTAVDASFFPAGTRFVQLAAGDNATLALTDEGLVYGWGTFKVSF